jgi:hypothetical protein
LSLSLILLESQSVPIPKWVDAEYLYRINYGPATVGDVAILNSNDVSFHLLFDKMVTILLDRRVSQKLQKTLYPNSRSDVTPKSDQLSPFPGEDRDRALSSSFFDRSNPKTGILRSTQDFIILWFYSRDYGNKGLGTSRAPIAAVIFDMIDLVTYLSKITTSGDPHPVSWFLEDFLRSHPKLRSLPPTQTLQDRWPAVRGFLYDLFDVVSGLRVLGSSSLFVRTNGLDWVTEDPDWARCTLPGSDLLVGLPPVDPASVSDGPIEELDAAFICSGPFKMRFTSNLRAHLQLNTVKRELFVYWEDNLSEELTHLGRKYSWPSTPGKLQQFESGHVLGRLAHSGLGSDWIACYMPIAWSWNCKLFSSCCSCVTRESRSVVSENYSVRTRSINFGHW